MNLPRRLTAPLLRVAMLVGMTACPGPDKTWATKTDERTFPTGVYIYCEYLAYRSTPTKAEDFTKPVLEQKIGGTDAAQQIKKKALGYTKLLFVISNRMKELKLLLTDAEIKEIDSTATSRWSSYKDTLEGYDISREPFSIATAEFNAKSSEIFEAIYGTKGSEAVGDADLKAYSEKNYTDFSYVMIPLYDPTMYTALDKKTKEEYKQFSDDRAVVLNKDGITLDAVSTTAQKKLGLDYAPLQNVTTLFSEEPDYPIDLTSLTNGMKTGEAKTITLSTVSAALLTVKNDMAKKTATQIPNANTRSEVLGSMKHQEFEDEMAKPAEESKDITINDKAIDSYQLTILVQKDTGSFSAAD